MRHIENRGRLTIFAAILAIFLAASCASSPPPKETTLSDLVVKGDFNSINKLLADKEKLKIEANSKDGQGLYPLHHAVIQGNSQIAEILIVFGSALDLKDPTGKTPLRYAIDRKLIPMTRMLVERGADPFIADVSGTTPAEAVLGSGSEMIAAVFNAKNIDASGQDGRTVLHMAADRRMVAETGLLLDLGASVQRKDKADRTALHLALLYPEYKDAAIIAEKLILRGAAVTGFPEYDWFATTVRSTDFNTVRFPNGNTPLHEAISKGQLGFAEFLLSKGLTPNIKNSEGNTPLHGTVKTGWIPGAELLLKNGADPDIRDAKNNTPLHLSAPAAYRLGMTQLLLRYKADPSLKDQEGNTALHKAVRLPSEPLIVEELLKAGAPVNSANLEGDTPLMICVKTGNYQYADPLIVAGADVFLRNLAGQSPLSIAVGRGTDAVDKIVLSTNVLQRDNMGNSVIATAVAMKGSPEVISLILSKGADPNTRNNSGDNALHVAVRLNLPAQGLLLINAKGDIFASNASKDTPVFLALAASDGPYDWFFMPSVITARDSNGDTVGHLAARKDLADGLEYLRSRGTDLEAINTARETLLHAAVRTDAAEATRYLIANGAVLSARDINGDAPLNVAVLSGAKTCLQVLVLSGVDLDARNFTGEAALHQAVRKQNAGFATYLVDRGAKLESRDNRGQTPLAAAAREAQTAIAQYLIKAGSRIDARDYSGATPLYQAVETGQLDLIRSLVQSNADILARNAAGDFPLLASVKKGQTVLREILGYASMDRSDSEGKTPLRLLVEAKAPADMLKLALGAGSDPSSRDKFANTPLHAAVGQKDYITAGTLLAAGADPFAPNYQGVTPIGLVLADTSQGLKDFAMAAGLKKTDMLGEGFLHYAVRAGKPEAVKLLLELGADRNAKNISGETASDVARTKGDAGMTALFQ